MKIPLAAIVIKRIVPLAERCTVLREVGKL